MPSSDPSSARPLRIASINVNGVRAAFRKGMGDWLADRDVDILAIQEVRASTEDLEGLLGPGWSIVHDSATAKGRAGVAVVIARAVGRQEIPPCPDVEWICDLLTGPVLMRALMPGLNGLDESLIVQSVASVLSALGYSTPTGDTGSHGPSH